MQAEPLEGQEQSSDESRWCTPVNEKAWEERPEGIGQSTGTVHQTLTPGSCAQLPFLQSTGRLFPGVPLGHSKASWYIISRQLGFFFMMDFIHSIRSHWYFNSSLESFKERDEQWRGFAARPVRKMFGSRELLTGNAS